MTSAVVNGMLVGGLYALIALGLQLAFGVMRLVNLAQGEFVVGGAYLTWQMAQWTGLDPLLSLVLAMPVAAGIAYALQRVVLTPLLARGIEAPLVATFGLSLVLVSVLTEIFSGDPRALQAGYVTSGWEIGGVTVRITSLLTACAAIAVFAAVHLFLSRTRLGSALRASASDPDTARTMGINVEHIYGCTLAIVAIIAALAGAMIGLSYGFVPTSGALFLITAFTVLVLGGIESVGGVLVAGVLVGVVEGVGAHVVGGQYRSIVVLLLFLTVLMVRPAGLFGKAMA